MAQGAVFVNNRPQAIRLPAEMRFPKDVKKAIVRALVNERVLSPAEYCWDSFFISYTKVSDDFMTERPAQTQAERIVLILKYMLDTNVLIYLIKLRHIEILEIFNLYAWQMSISFPCA